MVEEARAEEVSIEDLDEEGMATIVDVLTEEGEKEIHVELAELMFEVDGIDELGEGGEEELEMTDAATREEVGMEEEEGMATTELAWVDVEDEDDEALDWAEETTELGGIEATLKRAEALLDATDAEGTVEL